MSTRHMSPSARAAAHAAKIQSREARRARTPGPGSYDPGLTSPNAANRPSSAFKSNSKRGDMHDTAQGDPGMYDPYATVEIAQTSRNTFARSARAGSGAFGTRSAREMATNVVGNKDMPGPGAYNSKQAVGLFDKMPSSAFRSTSQQRKKGMHEDTPGVGAYKPRKEAVEPNVRNAGYGMQAKSERFKAEKQTTDDNVGPGLYDFGEFMSTELERSVSKMSRSGAAFGTKAAQRELPHGAAVAGNPGPGSYDEQQVVAGMDPTKRASSAFKSSSKRMDIEDKSAGDPGSYDPYAAVDLAPASKNTFARSARSGEASFGTYATREMDQNITGKDTPGPGSYRSKAAQGDFQKAMPSSAFRSSSQQRKASYKEDTPGVGTYKPRKEAVEPSMGNTGHGMAGRGERFKAEKQTTDDNVGPGLYDAATGDDLASRSQAEASKGGSAVFSSDTVRGLPY